MTFLLFLTLLYFLPTIVGRHKRDVLGIFIVNFFFGWTVIGWVIAMVWACAAEAQPQFLVVAGPGAPRYCCHCGSVSFPSARFCAICGRIV
ncbi:MAG: superinfection immunity protein [Candidatus Acidiferrales bacterium]